MPAWTGSALRDRASRDWIRAFGMPGTSNDGSQPGPGRNRGLVQDSIQLSPAAPPDAQFGCCRSSDTAGINLRSGEIGADRDRNDRASTGKWRCRIPGGDDSGCQSLANRRHGPLHVVVAGLPVTNGNSHAAHAVPVGTRKEGFAHFPNPFHHRIGSTSVVPFGSSGRGSGNRTRPWFNGVVELRSGQTSSAPSSAPTPRVSVWACRHVRSINRAMP